MWATTEILRICATVVVGVLAGVFSRGLRRDPTARAAVLLLATVAAHLLFPLLWRRGAPAPVLHLLLLWSLAASPAFWLLAQVHFDDNFRLRPGHLVMAAAFLAIGYVSWLVAVEGPRPGVLFAPEHGRFWSVLPRLLGLAIVLHALLRVYVGAGADLVLPRRRARFAVLALSGTYVLIVLLGEALFSGSESEALAEAAHSLAVLVLVVGVALASLRIAPEMLPAPRAALEGPAVDPALLERLRHLLEVDGVFREEGLTIGRLAERLGAQEYKVRQLINTQLGFKNFNALLNQHRVAAAEKLLGDRAQAHLGVAEIAYQVGYRSVATFNRAFKELTGRTPSEYRASRTP